MDWQHDSRRPRPGDCEEVHMADTFYQRFNGICTPGSIVNIQSDGTKKPTHRIILVDMNNKEFATVEPDMWKKQVDPAMWTATVVTKQGD